MNRLILRAGIVSVAGIAILGGTVAQAMAAPVSVTASGSVAREYVGIGFTAEDAIQNARINLAQGTRNLHITCTERAVSAHPFDNTLYPGLGDWLGTVSADCSE